MFGYPADMGEKHKVFGYWSQDEEKGMRYFSRLTLFLSRPARPAGGQKVQKEKNISKNKANYL